MVDATVLPATKEAQIGNSLSRLAWAKHKNLFEKYLKVKRTRGMIQVVVFLPSKCDTLNSKPNSAKQNKTKKIQENRTKGS
jgi:hypothetical protein